MCVCRRSQRLALLPQGTRARCPVGRATARAGVGLRSCPCAGNGECRRTRRLSTCESGSSERAQFDQAAPMPAGTHRAPPRLGSLDGRKRCKPALFEGNGEPDRGLEEDEQRDCFHGRGYGIDAGQGYADAADDHVADLAISAELGGAECFDAHEAEHDDRKLEDGAAGGENQHCEGDEVGRPDLDVVDRVVVVGEEVKRRRERDFVAEGDPADHQRSGEQRKADNPVLRLRSDRRGEEAPELPEHDRQRKCKAERDAYFQRGGERLRDSERQQVTVVYRQLIDQQTDDAAMDGEREDRGGEDGSARDKDPRAKLLEVPDQFDFLAVRQPTRKTHSSYTTFSVTTSTGAATGEVVVVSGLIGAAVSSPGTTRCDSVKLCSSLWSPVTESLNSRKPLPSPRPISGRRFGPNRTSATRASKSSSGIPMKPGIESSF